MLAIMALCAYVPLSSLASRSPHVLRQHSIAPSPSAASDGAPASTSGDRSGSAMCRTVCCSSKLNPRTRESGSPASCLKMALYGLSAAIGVDIPARMTYTNLMSWQNCGKVSKTEVGNIQPTQPLRACRLTPRLQSRTCAVQRAAD